MLLFGCAQIVTENLLPETTADERLITEAASEQDETFELLPGAQAQDENTDMSENKSDEDLSEEELSSIDVSSSVPDETYEEVDLSINMPDPNGEMQVSTDPENKYIKTVVSERKIDSSLLVAVFSVPESGQNYVFEFQSSGERSADGIRRVFFINSSGKIESVAASKSNEKENLSATENWFSMNVLIKRMIFPAIKDMM